MAHREAFYTDTPPAIWYDYVVQAWIRNGYVQECGHPAHMKPSCCYAGSHAGELADVRHFRDDDHGR